MITSSPTEQKHYFLSTINKKTSAKIWIRNKSSFAAKYQVFQSNLPHKIFAET